MTDLDQRPGMSAAWRTYALQLRDVLESVGAPMRACMPEEPEDCGADYAHHCMSYLAALTAKAENGLWHLHHGEAGQRTAQQLLDHWRGVFRDDDCNCT